MATGHLPVAAGTLSHEGAPRLVLRFAVTTAIALALAASAILLVVRHFNTVQAERAATARARVIATAVLTESLRSADFARPVGGARRSALDGLFEKHVLAEGVLLVKLYSDDGTVTYSTDHRLIGTRVSHPAHLDEALAGTIRGDVTELAVDRDGREASKVLRTYAPVAVGTGTGVVALFQDYRPIAKAAEAAFLPVAGILEAVLVLLFIVLAPILRRVTRRVRRQMEEIEYRALYDDLTGLPNRTLFRDRVEQAIVAARRDAGRAAVLLLDVDRFKEINDALGHDTGDRLLVELGGRLRDVLRRSDSVARLGGDEFGVLLPSGSADDATELAERIHAALEAPFLLGELQLEVAASIGVVAYPEHGEGVDALVQHADVAMYVAKATHARTAVYDAEQDTNDAARLALAGELRRAIDGDELVVYYQPKADLVTGRIVGSEALVRWQHRERGLIPPNEFIPIAEKTGLIKPLSRRVLAVALAQSAKWAARGHDTSVSVNLTVPDLLDLDLPDRIAALLAQTGARADQLELEITESTILADPFRVGDVLGRLNDLGLRLAIDDFGTGYSSLAYLKRLPVQTIKIDRSFVMAMDESQSDATIVRSTIDLGRNLDLDVVAEGVETQESWDVLRDQGCTFAQGYFIGRPMPADEFEALLHAPLPIARPRVAAA